MQDLTDFKLEAPAPEPIKEPPPAEPAIAVAAETPPEPVAAEPVAEAAPTAETAPAVEPEPAPEPPAKMIPKDRFNQVIEERNALRKQNEYLMDLAVKGRETAAAPEAPPPPDPMPTLEKAGFDTGKYETEMKAWTQKQVEVAQNQGKQVGAMEAHASEVKAAFEARMSAYAAANPKVVVALGNPNLPRLAREAAEYVMESELGPQILEHLGMHPDEALRIARQSPAKQGAAVGRIEAQIEARAKAPVKRVTQAPAPPAKINGASTPTVDPAKMSTKEWILWDRKQEELKRAKH